MKVMLVDPWGTNNTSEYLNGLIYGFSDIVELNVYTNYHFEQYVKSDAVVHKVFFKKSEKMKQGKLRTVVRGIEYIEGYRKVINRLKKEQFDVVHINWLLNYRLDVYFLKIIKENCGKIVYTAHNVLPHVDGEKSLDKLKEIYDLVDEIIVHGQAVKQELLTNFPGTEDKIYIQKHGCVLKEPSLPKENSITPEIKIKLEKFTKVFLCCGAVFPNKGIDRVIDIWLNREKPIDALLIVGGRQTGEYPAYEAQKSSAAKADNILLLDGFIDNDLLETLFFKCTMIILPYRHASMSGIVFSAAQYSKPILCTDVGALPEYLHDGIDSIVCKNSKSALNDAIEKAVVTNREELSQMGIRLRENILKDCDWRNICEGVLKKVYKTKNNIGE